MRLYESLASDNTFHMHTYTNQSLLQSNAVLHTVQTI